ncbi:MAG: bifunctional adenosylcobinamide kinase/adenosylcobinamide-phosphate guanylyltransferase [Bryobacteraceae bacterium]|nr:bifunctional adenosylcobinamide kinase/adenosylcobinamide-phosphate guanylyltransferase [Bryobacteraceae bacterium]
MGVTLIGGGSRSGKSRFALELARGLPGPWTFVATAEALDLEMRDRIARHQAGRDPAFRLIEEPHALAAVVRDVQGVAVVDCLTLWVSNRLLAEADLSREFAGLREAAARSTAELVFVTNEVGCGVVPDNALARRFRDEAGRLNQMIAGIATRIHWMVFGHPMRVK